MQRLLRFLLILLGLPLEVFPGSVSTIYEFPSGTWVENIAVRSNGNILVVLYSEPSVYEINPFGTLTDAKLVAHFDGYTGIQGIVETTPDVFAVLPFDHTKYSLWTFDISRKTQSEIINTIPDVGTLNGLTKSSDTILLASDTKLGAVVRLDLTLSSSTITIKDDTMAGLPVNIGIGINGVRVNNDTLFFANSIKGLFCRLRIDPKKGTAVEDVKIVARGLGFIDDLAIGAKDGDVSYLMQYLSGSVLEVRSDGSFEKIASGLNFPTSAVFGRTKDDNRRLYVSSSGNPLALYLKGLFAGGKVYAIDLD